MNKFLPSTVPAEFKESVKNVERKMQEHASNYRGRKYIHINIIALNIKSVFLIELLAPFIFSFFSIYKEKKKIVQEV